MVRVLGWNRSTNFRIYLGIRAPPPASDLFRGESFDESDGFYSYQSQADHRCFGVAVFAEAQLASSRAVRDADHQQRGPSIPESARGAAFPARRQDLDLALRRSAVLHPAALHAAGA